MSPASAKMLPLKVGGLALLFCLNPGDCEAKPDMRILVEQALATSTQREEILKVIQCESGFNSKIQSQHKDPKGPNGLENSWGLVQINLDHNPQVSLEEALDWRYSLKFIKENFAAGRQWMWTCWKQDKQMSYGR